MRNGFGAALAAQLAELGYDRGDLSAEMLDALFELPSMRVQAFLEWFLAAVTPRQSVVAQLASASDYAIYTALLDGRLDHGLLHGDELSAQESACRADLQQHESLDALLAQNVGLEHDIAQLEAQLQRVNAKNDRVTKMVQRATLRSDTHARRWQHDNGDNEHFRELVAELQPLHSSAHRTSSATTTNDLSEQIDSMLEHLSAVDDEASARLESMQATAIAHPAQQQWREHLYQQQSSLTALQTAELRNLDELKAKVAAVVLGAAVDAPSGVDGLLALSATSSSLDGRGEAAAALSEHSDSSAHLALPPSDSNGGQQQQQTPPSWLHDADPEALQLHEQDALTYNRCSLELARLEKAYATGEQDALLARMQVAKSEALLAQLSDATHSLRQQFELMSASALAAKQQQLQAAIERTKCETQRLVRDVLPRVCDEVAFLKSTTILLGSYEQKLWRQEHRFLQLRALLDAFDHQHGRLKLIHRFLDVEHEDLEGVAATLTGVFSDVESRSAAAQARLTYVYTDAASTSTSNASVRACIPDTDEVTHVLFDHLQQRTDATQRGHGAARAHHPFRLRTFDELVRLCERARADDESIADGLEHVDAQWRARYSAQHAAVQALRLELFGDATSVTPMLVPPTLTAQLHEAIIAKERTEQELHAMLETLRIKKRALAMDPSMRQLQQANAARMRQELEQRGALRGSAM